jgi:hypothetical protein
MAELAEVWSEALPTIRQGVTGVGIWAALNATKPLLIVDNVAILGLPHEDSELAGHLKLPNVRRLIDKELSDRLGQPTTARIIDGVTLEDWERTKKRDAESRRLQEVALNKMRSELAAKSNWDSVYEQLSRRYAAVTNKSLPQNRARFLEEAIELVAEARKNQQQYDEMAERNFARCIERVSQYADVPSTIIAVQVLQRAGEL